MSNEIIQEKKSGIAIKKSIVYANSMQIKMIDDDFYMNIEHIDRNWFCEGEYDEEADKR